MAESGRTEELRRRLERDPGSRLFAQLAEELRKDSDLQEAVRVSRAGLEVHPSYTSARLTLGRALEGLGRLAEARVEYEAILRAAPDNLIAGRQLADCLEALGQTGLALERCERTLRLAPGDRVLEGRIADLKRQLGGTAGGPVPLEPAQGAPPPLPTRRVAAGESEGPLRAEDAAGATPTSSEGPKGGDADAQGAGPGLESTSGSVALASPTLAELYFKQGSPDRAVEVYRKVVADEPDNAKAKARLSELEQVSMGQATAADRAGTQGAGGRRAAVERVIGRLKRLVRATRRG